jgi:hypothetical protein
MGERKDCVSPDHMEVGMQKISGILSASSRVTSVDMKEAPPVRPGTPGFGRPEGVSSLRERPSAVDALRKGRQIQDDLFSARSKESQQAESVAQMSDRFFSRNSREADSVDRTEVLVAIPVAIEMDPAESNPAGFRTDSVTASLKESESEPDGLYPRGSFIDKTA